MSEARPARRAGPVLAGLLALMGLTACATAVPAPTPYVTGWGEAVHLGSAALMPAPALAWDAGAPLLAWPARDEASARLVAAHPGEVPQILALSVTAPFSVQMWPAEAGTFHLLWLDTSETGILQLQSATFSRERVALLGALTLAEEVYHYSAIALADGGLRIVYARGPLDRLALYHLQLDAKGRPAFPQRLHADGDTPVLLRTLGGEERLYWAQEGAIWGGWLDDATLRDIVYVERLPRMDEDAIFVNASGSATATHAHLFWQFLRPDGTAEVQWLSAPLDGSAPGSRQRLAFGTGTTGVVTGYNDGGAQQTISGGPVRWVAPHSYAESVLPVAFSHEDGTLGVFYLAGAEMVAVRALTTTPPLLGAPAVLAAPDRHLALAWAQPATRVSDIWVATTRR